MDISLSSHVHDREMFNNDSKNNNKNEYYRVYLSLKKKEIVAKRSERSARPSQRGVQGRFGGDRGGEAPRSSWILAF